jgi:hypothetical protein
MKLHYDTWSDDLQEIEERLKSLCLQYSLSQDQEYSVPVLYSGKSSYSGTSAIHSFIDQLQDEAPKWWYCDC